MTISYNTSIVRDGLMLYYDADNNKKSWKGQPATNLVYYNSTYNLSPWSLSGGSLNSNIIPGPFGGSTGSLYTHPLNNNLSQALAVPASTTVTLSLYVKQYQSATVAGEFRSNGTDPGGTWTFNFSTGIITSTSFTQTATYIADGWYRLTITLTTNSAGTAFNIYFYGSSGYGSAGALYIYGVQVETGSYATPLIPTLNGTASRDTTQSLVDITNKNVITTNSLTYASNNTFSFNGTANYVSAPSTSLLSFPDNRFTFDVWVYFNDNTSNHGILARRGSWEYSIHSTGNSLTLYTWTLSGALGIYNNISYTYAAATWYNLCWTADGTTVRLYVNGVFNTSSTKTANSFGVGTAPLTLGAAGDAGGIRYLNGKLSKVKIYNKGLSATEVKQNFEAHRDIYGI